MFFRRDQCRSYAHLAALLELGEPLDRALPAVAASCSNKQLKKFWSHVQSRVAEGDALSDILRREPHGVVSLIRAGEGNGTLPHALRMAAGPHRWDPASTPVKPTPGSSDVSEVEIQGPVTRIAHSTIQQAILQEASALAWHPGWYGPYCQWPPPDLLGEPLPPSQGRETNALDNASPTVAGPAVAPRLAAALEKTNALVESYGDAAPEPEPQPGREVGLYFHLGGCWRQALRLPFHIAPPVTRRYLYMASLSYWKPERQQGKIGVNFRERDYDLRVTFDPQQAPSVHIEIHPVHRTGG